MHQEFNEASGDAGFDNRLNLVVGAIRQVRDCPARVDEHFVIERVDKFGEYRERWFDLG